MPPAVLLRDDVSAAYAAALVSVGFAVAQLSDFSSEAASTFFSVLQVAASAGVFASAGFAAGAFLLG